MSDVNLGALQLLANDLERGGNPLSAENVRRCAARISQLEAALQELMDAVQNGNGPTYRRCAANARALLKDR